MNAFGHSLRWLSACPSDPGNFLDLVCAGLGGCRCVLVRLHLGVASFLPGVRLNRAL
jgi:hypothetical protein